MKKAFYIMMLAGCALHLFFLVSCNGAPTYEELKTAERKVVQRIINDYKIEVLKEYPADGKFADNQFVELSSGIYLNVVDSGVGRRAQQYRTMVLVRASGYIYDADTPALFNTFASGNSPFEFKCGYANYVSRNMSTTFNSYYYFFGSGLESILSYVGDSAVVKLIVPGYSDVNGASGGSTYQTANTTVYYPIYYDKVKYIFY